VELGAALAPPEADPDFEASVEELEELDGVLEPPPDAPPDLPASTLIDVELDEPG
jgi:hypothetical protein